MHPRTRGGVGYTDLHRGTHESLQLQGFHLLIGRNSAYDKSADGWVAWPPARLFHGVPRLNGVVPQHPPLGQRHRRARWLPAVGRQRDPLGMSGSHVVSEANALLLLIVHELPLTASLGGTVLVTWR